MEPYGKEFAAFKELKSFTDENDIWLIYDVNENKDYIFKTLNIKMNMAKKMHDGWCKFQWTIKNIWGRYNGKG